MQSLLLNNKKTKIDKSKFLLPLNIDFGIRSIRQSLNYAELNGQINLRDNGDGDVFDQFP
jgi:hypothetical protein